MHSHQSTLPACPASCSEKRLGQPLTPRACLHVPQQIVEVSSAWLHAAVQAATSVKQHERNSADKTSHQIADIWCVPTHSAIPDFSCNASMAQPHPVCLRAAFAPHLWLCMRTCRLRIGVWSNHEMRLKHEHAEARPGEAPCEAQHHRRSLSAQQTLSLGRPVYSYRQQAWKPSSSRACRHRYRHLA
jgi:hypothetical protein